MKSNLIAGLILFSTSLFFLSLNSCQVSSSELEWPEIKSENKPWTRWWWMGSAVNEKDLTLALEEYSKAGIGGVEITPIYGAKGYENNYIDYLSEEWVSLLEHTLKEADKLDIGVDMATGTGWPFGGPWINAKHACKNIHYKIYTLKGGQSLKESLKYMQEPIARAIGKRIKISDIKEPISSNDNLQQLALEQIRFEKELPLVLLMAFSDNQKPIDLTEKIDKEGNLDWIAPEGDWKLYAVYQGWHGKMVERAAPGGEGNVIDHFSKEALEFYFSKFDSAFKNRNIASLRSFFNDSYEVDDAIGQADFTASVFDEFQIRRGYDLREYLPALFGQDTTNGIHQRVLVDYRLTISELLQKNFTIPWRTWANKKGAMVRNQAHDSPANILDLYALVDIPETEGEDLLFIKFASSAGHVSGKPLISCEASTWLDEHFMATLAQVKSNLERYFLGGVNHVVYHGTTYSPQSAEWPGWMFYASVHFAPTNSFWNDFSALNQYVTRCQSFLQMGEPDNDILIYYPYADQLNTPGKEMLQHFRKEGPQGGKTPFRLAVKSMIEKGYSVDYISDSQVESISVSENKLITKGGFYKVILVPKTEYIPLETMEKLIGLARKGATIIFHESLPEDIPGFAKYESKKETFESLKSLLKFEALGESGVSKVSIENGQILLGENLDKLLKTGKANREPLTDYGLDFIRRKADGSEIYYIINRSDKRVAGWIPVNMQNENIAIFNPQNDKKGLAKTRLNENGIRSIYLQFEPGEALILQSFEYTVKVSQYAFYNESDNEVAIKGKWELYFIKGGPVLPQKRTIDSIQYWTNIDEDDLQYFSGTAKYTIEFDRPEIVTEYWSLNLGKVAESATIILNGEELATLHSPLYKIIIENKLFEDKNKLEVLVSNRMTNRIIYMEKEGIPYKKFYNVNFPARKAENRGHDGLFTTSHWEPLASGLAGPVKLVPCKVVD